MKKVGRKERSYEMQDGSGKKITGLTKTVDGRWRFWTPAGQEIKFTEPDERLAVKRFQQATAQEIPTVDIPLESLSWDTIRNNALKGIPLEPLPDAHVDLSDNNNLNTSHRINKAAVWEWLRAEIIANPVAAAANLRLPAIARMDFNAKNTPVIAINTIRELYTEHAESNWRTKGQVKAALNRLKQSTGAETLADLTTAKVIQFREVVNAELEPTGAAQVFGKIKSALSFAMKHGSLDNTQLAAALAQLKTLYAPRSSNKNNPTPTTPSDFRKLLAIANAKWRAILLLGLNGALYAEDIATLKWADFDLDAATYTGQRAKTAIVRVLSLWQETVSAIRSIPRRAESPYLFTSQTGTRFAATTLYDTYKELRDAAGVSTPFSGLRDAAYTIACRKCDDRVARVFAAHKMPGLLDSYVQRNPEFVKPAADAVYAAFGPFPLPQPQK